MILTALGMLQTDGSLDAKTVIPWLKTVHTHIKVKNFFMHPVNTTNTF
jgi:hypothetical protein